MSLAIVENCVNCYACLPLCPSDAIYEGKPHIKIDAKKCTECEGDYAAPQCATICPIEEAILDAKGLPLNPLGTLTGIPPAKLAEVAARLGTNPLR